MSKRTILTVMLLGALYGCDNNDIKGDIRRAEAKWSLNGIVDYTFVYNLRCYCRDSNKTIEVEVVDGKINDAYFTDPTQLGTPSRPLTIDRIFYVLKNTYLKKSYDITFRYDEDLGVPTYIHADHPKGMDAVITFELRRFKPQMEKGS